MVEHQRTDSLVDQLLYQGCGTLCASDWRIIDQCNVPQKLITVPLKHIAHQNPLRNTHNEYRRQELTLKFQSTIVMLLLPHFFIY